MADDTTTNGAQPDGYYDDDDMGDDELDLSFLDEKDEQEDK